MHDMLVHHGQALRMTAPVPDRGARGEIHMLLRAVVGSVTGDLRTATRMATTAGRGLGWLIIAGGSTSC
jgi:uncharacterized protein (DUF305 family)